MNRPPILVTGSPRSGTTWVGQMLASCPGIALIFEPFNPSLGRRRSAGCPAQWFFTHVGEHNGAEWISYIQNRFGLRHRLRDAMPKQWTPRKVARWLIAAAKQMALELFGHRVLMKDPIALYAAEWLARSFDMQVVVMVRHPAAYASSVRHLGWRHDMKDFLSQPCLMESYLQPFADEIELFHRQPRDILEEAVLLWRIHHHTIAQYRQSHPDWIFLRHEDLSLDPLFHFRKLIGQLGLTFTPRVQRTIESHSGEDNPVHFEKRHFSVVKRNSRGTVQKWKKYLSGEEIRLIRDGTMDVAAQFYSDADW